MFKKLLILSLLTFPIFSNAQTLIVTVCDDPALFVYTDGKSTYIMLPEDVAQKQKEILKDIENGNASLVQGELYSDTAICGSLF